MTISTVNTTGFISAPLNSNTGAVAGPLRSQTGGELPASQVAPSPAAGKAENEASPEVTKAKQQAASERLAGEKKIDGEENERDRDGDAENDNLGADPKVEKKVSSGRELSEDELQQIQDMAKRDREVRAHESAHRAVAGQYAQGGMTFSYEIGPDGKRYAVAGEVSIDTAPVPGDPEATLQKANAIRQAAMAPAEPSGQDRSVAIQAMHMAAKARVEIVAENVQNANAETDETGKIDAKAKESSQAPGNSSDTSTVDVASLKQDEPEPRSQAVNVTDAYRQVADIEQQATPDEHRIDDSV